MFGYAFQKMSTRKTFNSDDGDSENGRSYRVAADAERPSSRIVLESESSMRKSGVNETSARKVLEPDEKSSRNIFVEPKVLSPREPVNDNDQTSLPRTIPNSDLQDMESSNEISQSQAALTKLKILGVSEEEMKRWAALKRMGLSYSDLELGSELVSNITKFDDTKQEKLTGYSEEQMKRTKAIKQLGVTEEDVETDVHMRLGRLGHTNTVDP